MSVKVKLFSKNNCMPCRQTKMFLEARNIPYEDFNLNDHPEYIEEVHKYGFQAAPVIVPEEESGLSPCFGFRPDELKKLVD